MSKSEVKTAQFDKICRLCLAEKRSLSSIFKTKKRSETAVPLHQRIVACATITMYEGDGLPEQICNKCIQAVNQSFALREQVEQADSQLREMLRRVEQEVEAEAEAETEEAASTLRLEAIVCDSDPTDAGSLAEDVNGRVLVKPEVMDLESDNNDTHEWGSYISYDGGGHVEGGEEIVEEQKTSDEVPDQIEEPQKESCNRPKRSKISHTRTAQLLAVLARQAGITVTKRSSIAMSARSGDKKRISSTIAAKLARNSSSVDIGSSDKVPPGDCRIVGNAPSSNLRKPTGNPLLNARRASIAKKIQEMGMKMADDKVYCKECKIFIGSPYFYNHIKFVHVKVRDHLCEDCGYRAQTGHILRQHIDAVHSDNTHSCGLCDRSFRSVKSARDHMRTVHIQTKERAFICQFCGKGFFTAHYLRNHIRTHTQETPYKCQYCDRRFSFKWPCTTHERLHTGVKPYKCTYCDEAFTQNCVRKNHEYRAHGNEEFNPKNRKPREGNLREKKKGKTKIVPSEVVAVSMAE